MNEFTWQEPESLDEVLTILAGGGEDVRLLAGGTAMGLMIQADLVLPCMLLSLRKLRRESELGRAWRGDDGTVHIGALATLRDLERFEPLKTWAPVLVAALRRVANPRIRNMATLGGHLAYAEPHLDLPPVLLAMGASVRVRSQKQERLIPLSDLFQGYYATSLDPSELILEVVFPEQTRRWRGSYVRYTAAAADDWPMLGLASFVAGKGGRIDDARLAVSGICATPTRLSAVEEMLCSQAVSPSLMDESARIAAEQFEVYDDIRGSAWYKKEILQVFVRRELKNLTGI